MYSLPSTHPVVEQQKLSFQGVYVTLRILFFSHESKITFSLARKLDPL
jgi:hypothetical protein